MKKTAIFFWQTNKDGVIGPGCLSQWARYDFVVDGVYYRYAEQYMMAEKARLFKDEDMLAKILAAKSPMIMKRLGRAVKGFDSRQWDAVKYEVVVRGNFAKFSQNDELKAYLLSTGEAILAEASPKDAIWGLGLDEKAAAVLPPDQWPGQNLLGKALMEVRERLRKGETPEVSGDRKKLLESRAQEGLRRKVNKAHMSCAST